MSDPEPVTVTVLDTGRDFNDPKPETLVEIIDWLTRKLDAIPAEHRTSATFNLYSGTSDNRDADILIEYERPETAEELRSGPRARSGARIASGTRI